MTFWSLFN